MTDLEWDKLKETLAHMTPSEKERLLALVSSSLARETKAAKDPLLGLMADEPDFAADKTTESAHELGQRLGLFAGLEEGPPDLSSNRRYMEGFGQRANRAGTN